MIEQVLSDLTKAIQENTAALLALKGEGATVTPASAEKPAAKEKSAPKEKTAPAPKKEEKPAAKTVDRDAIRKLVTDERARLTEQVSPQATAKHKEMTRQILTDLGATSVSDIAESKLAEAYDRIKAIDVNAEDDSNDGDDDL